MDVFGDHLVSCKLNKPTQRHNAVRDALANILRIHGIACQTEVAIGGKQRPADVAVLTMDARGPLALDEVITHPLSLSAVRDPASVKKAVAKAELEKIEKEANVCKENGWLFSPMGWHPWGGAGPHAAAFMRRLEKVVAGDAQGWARQKKINEVRRTLSFALMRFVARQLLAAGEAEPAYDLPAWNVAAVQITSTVTVADQVFTEDEKAGWDQPLEGEQLRDPPAFVGPIRITTRRA